MTSARVLLFEDDTDAFTKLSASLSPLLARVDAILDRYVGEADGRADEAVEAAITKAPAASVIVLDWDLSKYQRSAISRQLVRGAAEELYVPVCTYTSPTGDHGALQQLMKWQDSVIALDSSDDYDGIAHRCAAIASGFLQLERSRPSGAHAKGKLSRWIVDVLSAPAAAQSQVAEYAIANLQQLLQVADVKSAERGRLVTTVVGYWIHNQLLQFPGVLVNATAAASYLDIAVSEFEAAEVRKVFDSARYSGPFADVADYWWLAGLDDVSARAMRAEDTALLTGREAAERALARGIGRVRCYAGHEGAGYYCLITKAPVCEEHSVRPGTWLPIGADRSRIEKNKHEELSPWLVD